MALYVYSITALGHPCRLDGLTGVGADPAPLRTVTAGPLRAVVSDVDEEIRPRRRDLAAHQEVQERLMADGTVLPLQFGYTAPDDLAVEEVLQERADAYLEALERLDGCAEYNVKASRPEEGLLREILEDSAQARLLNDRIRAGDTDPRLPLQLGELVAAQVRDRQEQLAAGLVRALIPLARDHSVRAPADGDLLNLSLLVPDDRRNAFVEAETDLARQADDIEFRFTGPLPPYSFV
ncbi:MULTISPECIES: GvpL/GvpF family gas vesicle protein [Streptomyces]|uniref:GvpL/GvpF family gas vesicle protein n=1 Tax=Streptomyces TaxID=1883 RepID=UPI000F78234C|nr:MULTISPECIES: GvpL/GvpF family gas vesicle protein [Streptomyces]RST07029.1 GvpL/GvpF family gas vesicle protein [Streptomyces sp. WAC07149]GLX21659.1 gas vesicle protein [Streptomyces lavendulae subsp. lavendulae]GLX29076.1 gas vesicle protein [Streptomyces lavendulae subsp. lavendulae]